MQHSPRQRSKTAILFVYNERFQRKSKYATYFTTLASQLSTAYSFSALKMLKQDLYPYVPNYLDFLLKKVNVLFTPKDRNPEKEVELVLHRGFKYDDVALRLGNKIGADPAKIQFFIAGINDEPKTAIRRLTNLSLEEMLQGPYNRTATLHCKLFYEVLDISLAELELKRLVKITICAPTLKDCNPIEVWMPKTGRIGDLLREVKFESANGTGRIRVYEAINHRFHREFLSTDSLSQLSDSPSAQLYAEVRIFLDCSSYCMRSELLTMLS